MLRFPILRLLSLRRPSLAGLLLVATFVLALGANAVVFALVDALWLRPLPVRDPDRLVEVTMASARGGAWFADTLHERDLAHIRDLPMIEAVTAQVTTGGLMGDFLPRLALDDVGPVEIAAVDDNYFDVLGVRVRGRGFGPSDDRPGAPLPAVLSDRLWRRAFGSGTGRGAARIGSSRGPVTIVGQTPPGFHGARRGDQYDMWIPKSHVAELSVFAAIPGDADVRTTLRDLMPHVAFARLRPGWSADEASDAIRQSGARVPYAVVPLGTIYAPTDGSGQVVTETTLLRVATAGAILALLLGWITLAAVVVVQCERRRRECAVRLALGCTRRRLVSALLVELAATAAVGVTLAMLVAQWSLHALSSLTLSTGIELARIDLRIDWRVALFGIVSGLALMLGAGLLAAGRLLRVPPLAALAGNTGAGPLTLRAHRIASGLHAALTTAIVIAAGLLVRTILTWFGGGVGFDVDRAVFVRVQPNVVQFNAEALDDAERDAQKRQVYAGFLDELAAIPGVRTVALGNAPVEPALDQASADGVPVVTEGHQDQLAVALGTGGRGYAEALGIPLVAGNDFTERVPAIGSGGPLPVLISRALAEREWPGAVPLGRRLSVNGRMFTVQGVVENFLLGSARRATPYAVLQPTDLDARLRWTALDVVLGTGVDASTIVAPVSRIVAKAFPSAAQVRIRTGRETMNQDLGQVRLGAFFFGAFGAVALLLGVVGVFGLVSQVIETRRRELGVRLALGASSRRLVADTLLAGLKPVLVGVGAGAAAALLAAPAMRRLLYGVSARDTGVYLSAAVVLLASATCAGLAASRRLRRISPGEILRVE